MYAQRSLSTWITRGYTGVLFGNDGDERRKKNALLVATPLGLSQLRTTEPLFPKAEESRTELPSLAIGG